MKKRIFVAFVAAVVFSLCRLSAQSCDEVKKETLLYAEKGGVELYLDKYEAGSQDAAKPCLMFAFGGGFRHGSRDLEVYIPFFRFMAQEGYCVVSIDYRLALKDVPEGEQNETVLSKAIDTAAEDYLDATAFVLKNAVKWGVDRDMIVVSGSSAGAIASMQAAYELCNRTQLAAGLPVGFNYAGVISFAGAILGPVGGLEWKTPPCPVQMFHGDRDDLVPYNFRSGEKFGFFGPEYITEKFDEAGYPYWFYSVAGGGHSLAETPMNFNREEIVSFLNKFVKGKQKLKIFMDVRK